jgi:hypothetical protein
LQRIAAVLDEELVLCFQRPVVGEVQREFISLLGTEGRVVNGPRHPCR